MMDKETGKKFRVVFCENQHGSPLTKQQQPYNLVVDVDAVRLRDLTSNDLILEWPYNFVRRYGTSPSTFSVEVGRRSSTGEGMFQMKTTEGLAILERIHEVSKELLAKRGPKKPTIQKKDDVYTEPYTQFPVRPRDNILKDEVPDENSKESRQTSNTAVETRDGVTVTRIGQGWSPPEPARLEPPVPPRLEPPVPPRLEPPVPPRLVPPRLEPPVPPRLEPRAPNKLEPSVPSSLEPPLPPRLEPRVPTRLEPQVPPRLEPREQSRLEPPVPPRSETRTLTATVPENPNGSETDLYLSPTFMDSKGVNKDDEEGVAPHGGAIPTPHTRDDEEKITYWTSTSTGPRIRHKYEQLIISEDNSRRPVDANPAPGKLVVIDSPKRGPRSDYENVKILKK